MLKTGLLLLFPSLFFIGEFYTLYRVSKNKKYGQIIENIIIIVAVTLLLIFNSRFKFPIHSFIMIIFIYTLLGHTLIGQCMDAYHKNKYFDRFLHGLGAFSFALFIYSVMQNIIGPLQSPKGYIPYFIAAAGLSIGTFFEILEFMIDSISKKPKYSKHQHGLADTDFDLIGNFIGSVIAGVVSVYIFI